MQFANKNGTPFPIVLNASDNDMVVGSSNSFGKDWIANASATVIRRGLYGCICTSLFP